MVTQTALVRYTGSIRHLQPLVMVLLILGGLPSAQASIWEEPPPARLPHPSWPSDSSSLPSQDVCLPHVYRSGLVKAAPAWEASRACLDLCPSLLQEVCQLLQWGK